MKYIKRSITGFFKKAGKQFPVLLVTGPRQVGKTTFLKHIMEKERNYVSLDDPIICSLAREDPALFLQRFPTPLIIDEIQYAPELLPYIKIAVDKKSKPSSFWLTGSQQFHMMKGVSESLAGRVGIINLLGFSKQEIFAQGGNHDPFLPALSLTVKKKSANLNLKDLYNMIWRGSFPGIAQNNRIDRNLFYASYVQTYLQRDVRDLSKVGDELAFMRFLRVAAARTGQLLNMADMSRDADISNNTAKNWLSILQASGIIYLLEPYHTNLTKRLVKCPKLYFLDTGLASYLTEWSSPETLEAGAMTGAILETWLFSEILKSYWHNGQRVQFNFYRDKDKKEIDLLIIKDGAIYPVEFKKTASPGKKNVSHFSVLKKLKIPIGPGCLICLAEKSVPLNERVNAIPFSEI